MNKDFRKKDFGVILDEHIKQRDKEVEKIAFVLDNALCIVDEGDYDELLLNVARIMYFCGCRVIEK